MKLKKWIVKQLLNCKWIKEAMYEALWKEYVEKLQKDFSNLKRDYKTLSSDYERINIAFKMLGEEIAKIKETIIKTFPISSSFDEVLSILVKFANLIIPILPKKEETPKKRKYTKKKK